MKYIFYITHVYQIFDEPIKIDLGMIIVIIIIIILSDIS
jgi:hypothetical protein